MTNDCQFEDMTALYIISIFIELRKFTHYKQIIP